MSEEIKAAAERLSDVRNHYYLDDVVLCKTCQQRVSMLSDARQLMLDGIEVARAWRAEHPADEDEPIDKTWLRTIGAEKDDHPEKFTFFRADDVQPVGIWNIGQGQWKAVLRMQGNWSVTIARGLKTRDDVRRLCASLGIKLTEPGAS